MQLTIGRVSKRETGTACNIDCPRQFINVQFLLSQICADIHTFFNIGTLVGQK